MMIIIKFNVLIKKVFKLSAHVMVSFAVYWVSSVSSYRNDQTVHHKYGNTKICKIYDYSIVYLYVTLI